MGFYIFLAAELAAGALSIHLLSVAANTRHQRDSFRRDLRNPLKWFIYGLFSPVLLFLAACDEFLIMEHTGYVDGREARDEVARRKAEQIQAQMMITGWRDVD